MSPRLAARKRRPTKKARPHVLYGSNGSGSAAVEIALEMTATPYEFVRASSWEPDSAIKQLRRLNPLGQIPTLVLPDGSVMTESAAILTHLGLVFPESGLLPADPSKRAQALRGLVFIAANCYSAVGVIDHPGRWCLDADTATLARIDLAARAQLHRNWEIFADQFPASPFLGGKKPGALDALAVIVSRWAGTRAHLAKARPKFLTTLKRIERQPVIADVVARRFT